MRGVDALFGSDVSARAVSVYLYLRARANRDGVCFPAIPTMARDLRLSESTVKRALRELVAHGHVDKSPRFRPNGGKSSNLYRLTP